jgi:hypothetical protein
MELREGLKPGLRTNFVLSKAYINHTQHPAAACLLALHIGAATTPRDVEITGC